MADEEQWFSVTRTWYVRAEDWYGAAQATKRNSQEHDLRITVHGQHDPRLPAGMHCNSCDGHSCPDVG